MEFRSLLMVVLILALGAPALAQAPPKGVRGTVEKLEGHKLTVKSRDGGSVDVTLAPDFTVRTVVPKSLTDLKTGDKVGITSVNGPDGTRQAIEIHILPANIPNLRLSQYPWNLAPDSLMTNAEVALVSGTPQAGRIKVTFGGKDEEFAVPPGTPIVGYDKGEPALLQPGTTVMVFARALPDGTLTAGGVTAEKNGVKPPM